MDFTSYIIISTVCLSLSYGLFRLIYRNGLRFVQQRAFLIASLVLSVFLPFSHFTIDLPRPVKVIHETAVIIPITETSTAQPVLAEKGFFHLIPDLLPYIYIIVSVTFILIILFQLLRITWLYRISEKSYYSGILVLRTDRIKSPFSFFCWVFIPQSISDREEIKSIIIHESVHADHYHSLDNLIIEFATALMWFNPVIWLMKRSLHLVHEYLADEGTLEAGVEKIRYQALLVNQAAEARLISIPSNFNNNLLKKRIIMMTKNNNSGHNRFRIATLLPLSFMLFLTVAVLNGLFIQEIKAADGGQEQKQKVKKDKKKEVTVVGYGTPSKTGKEDKNKEVTVVGYGTPSKTGKDDKDKAVKVDGYETVRDDKNKEITVVGYATKPDTINYIVDGVRTTSIDDLNTDSIESVNVLKTDRTVIVRTKGFARKHVPLQETIRVSPDNNILYIVDEKEVTKDEFQKLDVQSIESLDVVKGTDRIKKYTDKDYDGVILIKTKK